MASQDPPELVANGFTPPSTPIPIGVAGATGVVGQRFIQLLAGHPWFRVAALTASERSAGKRYGEVVGWKVSGEVPAYAAELPVLPTTVDSFTACGVRAVFSALDSSVAGEVESSLARAGVAVFSNARNHRMDPLVPILIPHANPEHVDIIPAQQAHHGYAKSGYIVTNANCSSTGLVVALRPLLDRFGLESLFVTTLQAISGAGYPGVPSLDITDNVVPYIAGEEDKMETEPQKILGTLRPHKAGQGQDPEAAGFIPAEFKVSAQCNRVPVIDGHTECVSIKFRNKPASLEEVRECLRNYRSEAQTLNLPSAPSAPLFVHASEDRPQPRLDRDRAGGMVVTVGRVRGCPILDVKLALCSHNVILGAAGGSIQNAELCVAKGYLQ